MSRLLLKILFILSFVVYCTKQPESLNQSIVLPGIDVLMSDSLHLVSGKRVGLVTNPTGITRDLQSSVDVLSNHPDVTLTALFGPEHGVRGSHDAGKKVASYIDSLTGVPVYSLYGKTKKPTAEMLENMDVLIFDIQDIGSRAYTYIYTMANVMKAAAENNLPVLVLDRPNPLGGELVEGPMLEPGFKSFIGMYEIPYIYGLTIGELAQLFNTEFDINANLTVVPMKNWQRWMRFDDTGLEWVPTSPHIPRSTTPFFTATTGCMGELSKVNGGVGYTLPFELVGQVWINGKELADYLNKQDLPGVKFRPLYFTPYYTSLENKELEGVQVHIIDYSLYRPMETQFHILDALYRLYPDHDIFDSERTDMFDFAMGTDKVRVTIQDGKSFYNVLQVGVEKFITLRKKYMIYP